MALVLQLVETGTGTRGRGINVLELDRSRDLRDITNLGLTLLDAKQLPARVQQAVVAVQARDHAALRSECSRCGASCHVKDWRSRQIATLFGTAMVRLPRFRCSGRGRDEVGISWPRYCRSTPALDQQQAKTEIVAEVERLRWRTWNGKSKDARITLKRLRTLLPTLEREPVRKLRRAHRVVDRYLRSQSACLVNYAERWRAGLRVGMSLAEGTANFLVNKPMAKSQQMRSSRRGADLLLQVRCAVYNGALGSGFGQLFKPAPSSGLSWAEAA